MPGGEPVSENVIDLQQYRAARRPAQIPPELLAEVDAAARVYDALLAQGHELRFDVPEDGGPVRAELRSVDGDVVRRVRLEEVVGFDGPVGAA